jgi:hypothetical protein
MVPLFHHARFRLESLCANDPHCLRLNVAHRERGSDPLRINSGIVETAGPASLSPAVASTFAAIANGSKAYPPIGSASRSARLARVAEAGAWTEAALALVELELPRWHVRRIEHDGSEWYCTLSLHRRMPRELDDAVDGRSSLLPLAILDALLEARRRSLEEANSRPPDSPQSTRTEVVWCDNAF